MDWKFSKYFVATRPIFDEIDGARKRILYAVRTGEVRVINDVTWRMIEANEISELPTPILDDLREAKFVVPITENELTTVLEENARAARENETLVVVIQPTASCQLGCTYCGQKHTNARLTQKYQDEIVNRAEAKMLSGAFRHLQVRWFGGEPLSAMREIRLLSQRLQALASGHSLTYSALIVTNGLALTEKVARELIEDHLVRSVHITIDGVQEFHDASRPLKSGGTTFKRIFDNLVNLANNPSIDCEIKVRANVDQYSYCGISPLLRMIAKAGAQKRIDFYVSPVYSWGNDADKRALDPAEFASLEIQWLTEMQELGFPVAMVPSRKQIVCFAVDPNAELVDAMGNLFNCTEAPYVPAYGDPNKFAIGHLSTGTREAAWDVLGAFNDRVAGGEYPCTTCNMLPVCGGACPKAWLEGHKPCPSAKLNIEGRLLLSFAASRIQTIQSSSGCTNLELQAETL